MTVDMEVPFSILDTDLYKLTMQNAVLHHFRDAEVVIRFKNRSPDMLFNRRSFEWIQDRVNGLSSLRLTSEEREALQRTCPYLPDSYLDYLTAIRLEPISQVELNFVAERADTEGVELGQIECVITGPWRDTILYEVPIMAIISEGYFRFVDTDWSLDESSVRANAKAKAMAMLSPPSPTTPLAFSEFGTRRRRSFAVQDLVVQGLVEAVSEWKAGGGQSRGGGLAGTSNVYLALKYGLQPSGTIAHEWIMAVGATYGYKGANGRAMDLWEQVYPRSASAVPLTMLTDTFTARAFFEDYCSDKTRAERWRILRQDSGDPFKFVRDAKDVWKRLYAETAGGDNGDEKALAGRRIIFSDGLDVQKAIELQQGCDELGVSAAFGIGTSLTNDFTKTSNPDVHSKPLNIVIKLNAIDGRPAVKLSDDTGKYTGDADEVRRVISELNLSRTPVT